MEQCAGGAPALTGLLRSTEHVLSVIEPEDMPAIRFMAELLNRGSVSGMAH